MSIFEFLVEVQWPLAFVIALLGLVFAGRRRGQDIPLPPSAPRPEPSPAPSEPTSPEPPKSPQKAA